MPHSMHSSGRVRASGPTNGPRQYAPLQTLQTPWLGATSIPVHAPMSVSMPECNKLDFDLQAINEASHLAASGVYCGDVDSDVHFHPMHVLQTKTLSTISCDTQASSSVGSLLSPVQTDGGDTLTAHSGWSRGPSSLGPASQGDDLFNPFVCLGPHCREAFTCPSDMEAHVKSVHTHTCNWAGCDQPSFASRDGLIWHVKAEHLLVCPSPGCTETSFQSPRILRSHIAVAHPEAGKDGIKEWQLSPTTLSRSAAMQQSNSAQSSGAGTAKACDATETQPDATVKELLSVTVAKRKCQDQLRNIVEKKAKKNASTLTLLLQVLIWVQQHFEGVGVMYRRSCH